MKTYAANTVPGSNEIIAIGDTTDGQPVNATTTEVGYSGDGNIILFVSNATNLPNSGGSGGLYTYNIKAAKVSRIDISSSSVTPNAGLAGFSDPIISESGRYVTFGSSASNLIDGSTGAQGIMLYRRDTQTNTTSVVGAGYSGGLTQNWDRNLAVSNDGRFVLVSSKYLANSYPYDYATVLGDNASGTYNWTLLGRNQYYEYASVGAMSCDGAFAVFRTSYNIVLSDLRKGSVSNVTMANANSTSPIISCNGRYILYATTNRTDITPTPSGLNSYLHLVRYDRITGERVYIDSNSSNVFSTSNISYGPTIYNAQQNVFNASISDSGDVAFNYNGNTYIKHLSDGSGTLESIAKSTNGTYVNVPTGTMTTNGKYVFFKTDPYNLGLTPSASTSKLIRAKTGL